MPTWLMVLSGICLIAFTGIGFLFGIAFGGPLVGAGTGLLVGVIFIRSVWKD